MFAIRQRRSVRWNTYLATGPKRKCPAEGGAFDERNSCSGSGHYMSMPPRAPMPPPAGLSSTSSATMQSVVSIRLDTEAAFCSLVRVTLVGSSGKSGTDHDFMSLKTLENRGLSPILADFADFGGLSPILILVVCPRFCADFARRFCYDLTTAMVSTICNSSGELLRGFPVCPVNPKIFGPILDISHRGEYLHRLHLD